MADTEIPPIPLAARPTADGTRWRLPLVLRRRTDEGMIAVLVAEGPGDALPLAVLDGAGAVLARTTIVPGAPCPVFLPPGAALIETEAAGLGWYSRHKVGLKLHAFAAGSFQQTGLARWKAAGVAARTLRAALNAAVAASPARAEADIARWRRFRARFVEDFTTVPPAGAAPRLSLISDGSDVPDERLSRCAAALAAQTDHAFEWIVALPPERMAAAPAGAVAVRATAPGPQALAAALDAATGGLVLFLDAAGRPTRDAVALVRAAFAAVPGLALAYADEERLGPDGASLHGVFHPAFNRHLMEASGYPAGFAALPREDAERLGLDPKAGAAAVHDLLLRHASMLDGARIRHVPRVAFGIEDRPPGFSAAAVRPASDALARLRGVPVRIIGGRHLQPLYPVPQPEPLVSIVVPTRDRAALLGTALRSLVARTAYRAFEIVVVDNGSVEPETFALFEEIRALWPRTRIVRDDGDFNFPRICNRGVTAAAGDMILLLNNDVEVVEAGWLSEMVALAALPGTGIVGAKLLFADRTVQHAGAIVGLFRYADHWFAHSPHDAPGYQDRLQVRQNLSAVTAACLLIRRDVWDAIGPLDAERFAEDCNDMDLCLRARRAGYEVVWTPFAQLIHYESASRGKKRSKAHRARLKAQRARMEAIWRTATFVDPHYSPNLARTSLFADLAQAPEGPRDPRTDAV